MGLPKRRGAHASTESGSALSTLLREVWRHVQKNAALQAIPKATKEARAMEDVESPVMRCLRPKNLFCKRGKPGNGPEITHTVVLVTAVDAGVVPGIAWVAGVGQDCS